MDYFKVEKVLLNTNIPKLSKLQERKLVKFYEEYILQEYLLICGASLTQDPKFEGVGVASLDALKSKHKPQIGCLRTNPI